jgi:hypothetical protein
VHEQVPVSKPKGPRLRNCVIMVVVGILVAIPGVVALGLGLWHEVSGPTITVPGTASLDLGRGTYIVFEKTGSKRQYGPLSVERDDGVTIDSRQVVVTSPDDGTIPVRDSEPNESIDRYSDHYTAAVEFTTPSSGRYSLRFTNTASGTVMVRRPLGDVFRRRVGWIASVAVGWLIALAGAILLLVGYFRRSSDARATRMIAAQRAVAAAAWFPDPLGQRRLRYWDGTRWTEHTAD